jgi:dTDP-4-amino-4,6-dideoxygalactose transaminase
MKVPLLDLKAQYETVRKDVLAAIARVCERQQFILGPEVELAERDLASRLAVKHAVGTSSGTDALLATLMALGVSPGDEVITTTYSFFASSGSIARLGATPVFVDIEPVSFNIDPAGVASAVTSRTKAILPVHLFGLSADLDPILEAASHAGICVIEDACQAIGARYKGQFVGGVGAVGCISFFPSKGLGAFGDGGLVVTNDDDLAQRVRSLRGHGAEPKYFHAIVGGNFRLDALQAAVLRVKLPHLSGWLQARRENADRYAGLFQEAGVDAYGLVLPSEPLERFHTYHQYVVRVPLRDELRAHLQAQGIGTAVYYPVPLHLQECFSHLGYAPGSMPRAEQAAHETLALPMYPELTEEQQAFVVETIASYLRSARSRKAAQTR